MLRVFLEKSFSRFCSARRLGKRESEVSKWLTGRHNFTTNTIARISLALGAPIINVTTSTYGEVAETAPTMVAEDAAEYERRAYYYNFHP